MSDTDYIPSPSDWVRKQVETIEATGDTRSVDVMNRPVVMLTMRGAKSGGIRKVPLMRVEHDGAYLAVASKGGAPDDPTWAHNFRAHPEVDLQDGADKATYAVRELPDGPERDAWWQRAVETWGTYASYQQKTDRLIPLFLLERA